jgi:hypothetical protein
MIPGGRRRSIADPQQFLTLPKLALKAHAFGNPEARDDTPLDLPACGRNGSLRLRSRLEEQTNTSHL